MTSDQSAHCVKLIFQFHCTCFHGREASHECKLCVSTTRLCTSPMQTQ